MPPGRWPGPRAGAAVAWRPPRSRCAGSSTGCPSGRESAGAFALELFSPLRQRLPSNDREFPPETSIEEDVAILDSAPVVSFDRAAQQAGEGDDRSGPGLYHVVAAMSAVRFDLGAVVEFPLRLRVEIGARGPAGAAASTAGPLDAPGAATTAPSRAAGVVAARADRSPSSLQKALVALGGLLLGTMLVASVVALLGRSARPP